MGRLKLLRLRHALN